MDTGLGNLAPISEEKHKELTTKNCKGIFQWGEIVKLKGSLFKITHINKKGIALEIQPLPPE